MRMNGKKLLKIGVLLAVCCALLLTAPSRAAAEPCQHPDLRQERDYDRPAYKIREDDGTGYSGIYHFIAYETQDYCNVCGQPVGEPYYNFEDEWFDPHQFSGFTCTVCGYVKPHVALSEENFPDPGFRECLLNDYDRNHDGYLTMWDDYGFDGISQLIVENEVYSIQGLELLPPIGDLWLTHLKIEELDLSVCPYVRDVDVGGSPLRRLDISNCPLLEELNCSYTNITELDTSGNPNLIRLAVNDSPVAALDLQNNPNLEFLNANSTQVSVLDFRNNPKMTSINAYNCNLTMLDITACTELEGLMLQENSLTGLDLRNNLKIERIAADGNLLEYIWFGPSPDLTSLTVCNCRLDSLDVTMLPALEELRAYNGGFSTDGNTFTTIDVSKNPKLKYIGLPESVTELDVSHNPLLEEMDLSFCPIRSLDVTHNPKLCKLEFWNTKLEALDLSQNLLLESLNVSGCQLGWLDLSANTALKEFWTDSNFHVVSPVNGKLDLTSLKGFDTSRASQWNGGTVSGNVLIFQGKEVSFLYDMGNGYQERFTWSVGGSSGGFTYRMLDDGTVSLTECTLTGNIVIPETIDGYNVTNLGHDLFRFHPGITSVTVPKTVTSLGTNGGSLLAYVFGCGDLEEIIVAADNPSFVSRDGVLFSKDMSVIYQYPQAKADEEYHIPTSVTWVDCTGFVAAKNLRRLYIENKDTSWAGGFVEADHLTVYYRKGGRTEIKVNGEVENGAISIEGDYYPFYMSFGDDPDTEQFAFDAIADEIIQAVITPGMSDAQKARALHDYIISHAHYSMKYDDETGILVYGEGHCQGYSKTFKLLLDKAGVVNRLAEGSSRESRIGHMWNQIKINNIWYHVDCTWDDPTFAGTYEQDAVSGMERQNYFMVSTQFILQDHIWDDPGDDLSGWAVEKGETVYRNASGKKVTGWLTVDGNTFYFDENGKSVLGVKTINGKTYAFDAVTVFTDNAGAHSAGALTKRDLPTPDIILPAALIRVESQAFAGVQRVKVWVPDTVVYIAPDAFHSSVTILCSVGSYAEGRCAELGLKCVAQ